MIKIKTSTIKDIVNKISKGVENDRNTRITELLQIETIDNKIRLSVTNTQYYLVIDINSDSGVENFNVTIDASNFIKLVSKTTTENITLYTQDKNLVFGGNGKYIFPLELNETGKQRLLPKIEITPTNTFKIKGDTLNAIYTFNGVELQKDIPVSSVQKYYYVDNLGAITFSESPYILNFSIDKEFKVLLTDRLAQLLTLFKSQNVEVGLSNSVSGGVYQNKIVFKSENIELIAYTPDDTIVAKYPATSCRALQENPYPGLVKINRVELANALDRLNIFNKSENVSFRKAGKLTFTDSGLEITSLLNKNIEVVPYVEKVDFYSYSCYMNLEQLLRHTKAGNESAINIHYGNELCLMFKKDIYTQIVVELEEPDTGGLV